MAFFTKSIGKNYYFRCFVRRKRTSVFYKPVHYFQELRMQGGFAAHNPNDRPFVIAFNTFSNETVNLFKAHMLGSGGFAAAPVAVKTCQITKPGDIQLYFSAGS